MSIDWDKRQGTLGKHKHVTEDILDETTGAPGGTQAVSLLGPYTIEWDTEGQSAPFAEGGSVEVGEPLPAGAVVVMTWPVTSGFTTGDTATLTCNIGLSADSDPDDTMVTISSGWLVRVPVGVPDKFAATTYISSSADVQGTGVGVVLGTPVRLVANLVRSGNDPTAGSLDIYALIATPS